VPWAEVISQHHWSLNLSFDLLEESHLSFVLFERAFGVVQMCPLRCDLFICCYIGSAFLGILSYLPLCQLTLNDRPTLS
jgi:hypothetical protein